MRDSFSQHFRPTAEEVDKIWAAASFSLDANCLLNLYRYSDTASTSFIEVVSSLQSRFWITRQATEEFFQNRLTVISEQANSYDNSSKLLDNITKDLSEKIGHPYLPNDLHEKLTSILKETKDQLDVEKERQLRKLQDDGILERISSIFDNRIGAPLDASAIEEILKHGPDRMNANIPPGYKDYPKHKTPKTDYEKRSNFGDYILWRQLIEHSRSSGKPLVFVTDERKEDWWLFIKGRTIGPRTELIDEFHKETGQKILIYRPEQFLKHAKDKFYKNIDDSTISEIKDLREESRQRLVKAKKDALRKRRHRETIIQIPPNFIPYGEAIETQGLVNDHDGPLDWRQKYTLLSRRRYRLKRDRAHLQEELEREELLGEAQDSDSDNSNSTILRLISLDEEIEHIEKALAKMNEYFS